MRKWIMQVLLFILIGSGISQAEELPSSVEKAPSQTEKSTPQTKGTPSQKEETSPKAKEPPTQTQESSAQKETSQRYDLAMAKGVYLLNENRYDEAIGAFQEALLARPKDTEGTYYLGSAQRLSGQYQLAYATLKQVDASFQKVHFDLAVAAYHTERYDESVLALTSAQTFEVEPGARQAMVFYYLGLNYLQLKRFEEAAPQFLRAGSLSEELVVSARYYSGVAFYRQGVFEEAQEAFEEVLEGVEDEKAKASPMIQSAKAFLKEIEEKHPRVRRWSITTSLSVQQDSNVVLAPENAPLPSGISDKADLRTVLVLGTGFKLFETERSTGKIQYQLYQSQHQKLDRFDVRSNDLGLTMAYRPSPETPYQFDFAYHSSGANVAGSDYLETGLFSSAIDLLKQPKQVTRLEYRFSDKKFLNSTAFQNNDDRTGTNHALELSIKKTISDKGIKIDNGYIYDKESTRSTDWAYQGFRFYLSAQWPAIRGLVVPSVKAEATAKLYDNPNSTSITGEKRKDQNQTYTLTLTGQLRKGWFGSLQYQTNINGSNFDAFDYKRQVVSVTATALF